MKAELTVKQEKFCQVFIELGNASEAYRKAYNAGQMQSATVNRKAKELNDNGKITARLDELRAEHSQRHAVTVDSLIDELEAARQIAKEDRNTNGMISATMGKAKIMGFDKQSHEVTVKPIKPIRTLADFYGERTITSGDAAKAYMQLING
jgi:phage terminase small subunit